MKTLAGLLYLVFNGKSEVSLVVCPDCGRHAHLMVTGLPLIEALSKERLNEQMNKLVALQLLDESRAQELRAEIEAIPNMCRTNEEVAQLIADGDHFYRLMGLAIAANFFVSAH